MRTSFRLAAVTLVFAAALSASGCTPDPPTPKPPATATDAPLFASDEEALAAAEEAYAAYLAVSDQILMESGSDPERLLKVATKSVFEAQLEGYKMTASKGWTSTGGTTVDSVSLERYEPSAEESVVIVYACIDVSKVDVFDVTGTSVVSDARPDRTPVESTFDVSRDSDSRLLLSGEVPWSGENFCV